MKTASRKTTKLQKPVPKVEKHQQVLKVLLTPEEVADRADRAAQHLQDRDAKVEEHKAASKHAKAVVEAIEGEMRRLSHEVRTRSTYKPVDCERRYVYDKGIYQEVRLDTGEVIVQRKLTAEEAQMELPFKEE